MARHWFLTALLALASCGGPGGTDYGGADGKLVADLIYGLDDTLQNPKSFTAAVTKEAAAKIAAEVSRYRGLTYSVVGKPVVNGEAATAQVAMEQTFTGKKLGEKEWTFVKQGDGWRIQSAPLP